MLYGTLCFASFVIFVSCVVDSILVILIQQ